MVVMNVCAPMYIAFIDQSTGFLNTHDSPVLFICQRTYSSIKANHERGYLK